MAITPNYGYNIPVATDTVNLLTQCYPNFTAIDTDLKAVSDAAVTVATENKAGTVHNLVRANTSRNIIYFTATSDFTTGDTFTVDGNAVTTKTVSGTSLETGAFVINSTVVGVLVGSLFTVLIGGGSSNANGINYDNSGSGLAATNVQDAIDEVESNVATLDSVVNTELSASVLAGATSVTFTDPLITATAKLLLFFDDAFIPYTGVTVGVNSVTYTFDALANNATATLWIVD